MKDQLKRIYKKLSLPLSPNILPPLMTDIINQELTREQIKAVNETIQPLLQD